jgi:hypothetical protein
VLSNYIEMGDHPIQGFAGMKLVEANRPTPDIIRLFQEPRLQPDGFVQALLNALGQEKANNFTPVNAYLEGLLGDAHETLDAMSDFQFQIEQNRNRSLIQNLERECEAIRARAQNSLVELHRSKIRLNDLKTALCRFIIAYESHSNIPPRPFHSVEEWLDAASLAEMRLTRDMASSVDRNLQKLLALFMTFRSIVCSYDGPSMYIRQIENSIASLDALHEKTRLELEVLNAKRTLVQARQELTTAKIDLSSLQKEVDEERRREAKISKLMSLQEKSNFPQILTIGLCLIALAGSLGYYLMSHQKQAQRDSLAGISQPSCREIADQLRETPHYQNQVLIFRKFAQDIYFQANSETCEKLHRLDSSQITSLAELLRLDYATGNQAVTSYNGNRVLQVKDVGINKLVVRLSNQTAMNLNYKVRVLELANVLRGLLQTDKEGLTDDVLIVDLDQRQASTE